MARTGSGSLLPRLGSRSIFLLWAGSSRLSMSGEGLLPSTNNTHVPPQVQGRSDNGDRKQGVSQGRTHTDKPYMCAQRHHTDTRTARDYERDRHHFAQTKIDADWATLVVEMWYWAQSLRPSQTTWNHSVIPWSKRHHTCTRLLATATHTVREVVGGAYIVPHRTFIVDHAHM